MKKRKKGINFSASHKRWLTAVFLVKLRRLRLRWGHATHATLYLSGEVGGLDWSCRPTVVSVFIGRKVIQRDAVSDSSGLAPGVHDSSLGQFCTNSA